LHREDNSIAVPEHRIVIKPQVEEKRSSSICDCLLLIGNCDRRIFVPQESAMYGDFDYPCEQSRPSFFAAPRRFFKKTIDAHRLRPPK
jgi:hypothetical protein